MRLLSFKLNMAFLRAKVAIKNYMRKTDYFGGIRFKRLLVVDLEAAFMRIMQIIQIRNPALHIVWNAGLFWKKAAATYSPAGRSTIGADGLNFSVRNGKRWSPVTIAT